MSTCNGQCAVYWPPLVISGKPTAGPGARAGLLGTSRRGDGRMQVTYHGHPLYRFAGDKKAGDVKGEGLTGFGGRWDPVSPAGVAVRKPSASKAAYAGHAWQVTSPGFFATGRVTLIAYAVAGTAPGHVSTPGAGAISNVVRVPFTTGG
jgi:hypothetical protein